MLEALARNRRNYRTVSTTFYGRIRKGGKGTAPDKKASLFHKIYHEKVK